MTPAALEARGIRAGYGDLEILRGVRVRVEPGELVTIIGPNGAGKSTLIKAIFGLVDVWEGTILLGGDDISGRPTEEVARLGIGYVPQVDNVFAKLSVRENLEMGCYLDPDAAEEGLTRVLALFPALEGKLRSRAATLSGGQRQMVAMGRALMLSPKVLLLDEPSAGLQPSIQDEVFDLVEAVSRDGVAVLLVEQNAKKALARADRGYVLEAGRNKFEGGGRELLDDPKVGKLYLGG